MKSPLEKLRNIGLYKSGPKAKWDQKFSVHTEGLIQASKDMKDMRTCYDSLLSAAAAAANSAYEFSEALLEMGNCLLEKTAMHENGECNGSLSMLGKVQLELQKLVDSYRSHIIMTITNPSESLLNELRKVEEMKLQCDERREMFEYMSGQVRDKGRSRHGKGETFTSQQLQVVCEEYDDAARQCIFRVESLKQGQNRSLLTQATRHHAAQLNFFQKGFQSLEAVELHVKNVAEKQHIDYELCDMNGVKIFDERNSFETTDPGELSSYYRKNEQDLDNNFMLRNAMEMDQLGTPSAQTSKVQDDKGQQLNSRKIQQDHMTNQRRQAGTYSAPIYAGKLDPADRIREMQNTILKHNTHVLPTPADAKATAVSLSDSLPFPNPQISPEEDNKNKYFLPLPRPLTERTLVDSPSVFDTRKIKRQAFSDSLASKPSSNRLMFHNGGTQGSPLFSSSPKIKELHELPRPPNSFSLKPRQSIGDLGHSAPLVNRNREVSPVNRNNPLRQSSEGSPLPVPQLAVSRSFSIPSSSQRAADLHSGQILGSPQIVNKTEEVFSPPLTPLSLSNTKSPYYRPIRGNEGRLEERKKHMLQLQSRSITAKSTAADGLPMAFFFR